MAKLIMRFSKSKLLGLKPSSRPYYVRDELGAGLRLKVLPSGAKSFQVQKRANGRVRTITIGYFVDRDGIMHIHPEQAQRRAREIYSELVLGKKEKAEGEEELMTLGEFRACIAPGEKRCVDFRPHCRKENMRIGNPVSFDFLGFTHFWGASRKGDTVVYQKTTKGRIARTLKSFNQYCRKFRHKSLGEQYIALNRKLRGHYAYFGITGAAFAEEPNHMGEIQTAYGSFPPGTAEIPSSVFIRSSAREPIRLFSNSELLNYPWWI